MTIMHDEGPLAPQPLHRGPTSLWYQIAERLRAAIGEGYLEPGDQLPTETDLIERFSVARSTVRAALNALEVEGLIWRAPGKGSFVADSPIAQPVSMLAGFHEDTRARGLVPSARTKNVEWVVPPAPVATRLGIEQGKRAVLIERVLLANGEPIGMQRSVLPEDALGEGGLFTKYELDNGSLYALLEERSGASPRRATQVVGATLASGELATLLDVGDGAPLLKLERLCFDQADRPIELVDLWYRADRYRLSVEMMGSTR